MQCVAWAGMLAKYAQADGVAEAVVKTFDGAHPCALCLAIEESKEHGKNAPVPERAPGGELSKLCKDMPLFVSAEIPALRAVDAADAMVMDPLALSGRLAHAPPVPPPRA